MNLRTCLMVFALSAIVLLPAVVRADQMLLSIMVDNKFSKPVHFVLDGKYSCLVAGAADISHFQSCAFSSSCEAFDMVYLFDEGKDGRCIELDLDQDPHKLVMSWADQKITAKVDMKDASGIRTSGYVYEGLCTFAIRPGDTIPSLNCGTGQH